MANIKKVRVPGIAEALDVRDDFASHYLGITTTALEDGTTSATVVIGGNNVTAVANDWVKRDGSADSFIYTGSAWVQFAAESTYSLSADDGIKIENGVIKHTNAVTADATEGFKTFAYDAQGHITGATPATTAQADAINSGITATKVDDYDYHLADTSNPHHVTKSDVQLGNVTNDKQVKALSSTPTSGNIVTWGADDATVADSGIAVETTYSATSDVKVPTTKSITDNVAANATLGSTYAKSTSTTPVAVATSDTVNQAIGKLEKDLDFKAPLDSPTFTGTPTAPTPAAGTDTQQIATTEFVNDAIESAFSDIDAFVFKGTIGTGGTPGTLPTTDYSAGWTYRVVTAGTYAGNVCEVGDLIIAVKDYAAATASNNDWTVAQTNLDGAVTSSASSSTDGHIVVFDGTSGKEIKTSSRGIVDTYTASSDNVPSCKAFGTDTIQPVDTISSPVSAINTQPPTSAAPAGTAVTLFGYDSANETLELYQVGVSTAAAITLDTAKTFATINPGS